MVADFTTTLLDVLGVFLDLFFIRTIFENDDVSFCQADQCQNTVLTERAAYSESMPWWMERCKLTVDSL